MGRVGPHWLTGCHGRPSQIPLSRCFSPVRVACGRKPAKSLARHVHLSPRFAILASFTAIALPLILGFGTYGTFHDRDTAASASAPTAAPRRRIKNAAAAEGRKRRVSPCGKT